VSSVHEARRPPQRLVDGDEVEHPPDQGPSEELRERLAEFLSDGSVGQGHDSSELREVTKENSESLEYL